MINFLFGMTFVVVVLPLLDKIVELISTAMNVYISRLSVDIQQCNVDIQAISVPEQHTNAIGFKISNDEEYEDYDEDRG